MDDATLRAYAEHNPYCLGCGAENEGGVGFRITAVSPGEIRGTVSFSRIHEGAQGRAHGGAIATALDEAFGQLAQLEFEGGCATGELTVRYHRPTAADGGLYEVAARLAGRDDRKIRATADLLRDGETLASASAVMFPMTPSGPAPGAPVA